MRHLAYCFGGHFDGSFLGFISKAVAISLIFRETRIYTSLLIRIAPLFAFLLLQFSVFSFFLSLSFARVSVLEHSPKCLRDAHTTCPALAVCLLHPSVSRNCRPAGSAEYCSAADSHALFRRWAGRGAHNRVPVLLYIAVRAPPLPLFYNMYIQAV